MSLDGYPDPYQEMPCSHERFLKNRPARPGFDCSGLTQWAWRHAHVTLERTAAEQAYQIPSIATQAQLEPSDLVFYSVNGQGIDHVAIYIGNSQIIEAYDTGTTEMKTSINGTPNFPLPKPVGFGRP
jgi:cell wall-associated NlpC family hydrolase